MGWLLLADLMPFSMWIRSPQLMIMGGSIVLGTYVDRTRKYKGVTIALFIASSLLLIPLGIGEGLDNRIVLASLLAMGAAVGPIQPINAELAVEVRAPIYLSMP
ncbi:hypothetical protein CYMTET_7566 [Cymbomonas tetramitiformis]|uniref:MFS transporter n=1 Tax=Cymbomonas tetramitiformis TaxID=36881 RepID=A0AAE0GVF0_9CHLO|nr:hypothetical protein CYMTET_7566 [Cymbomonas tetramitiformis]